VPENIEKIFYDDLREKKRTGSNIHHKTGSRGYVGKMLFPTDIMSRKDKYNMRKAGKVERYNMYDTIINKDEFLLKDKELQKNLLTHWREIYENEKIMEGMEIHSNNTYHRLIKDLEIPKKKRGGARNFSGRPRASKKIVATESQPQLLKTEDTINTLPIVEDKEQPIKLLQTGLHLEYNGSYTAEQLSKIFTKLQLITDGEECKFVINISLTERS